MALFGNMAGATIQKKLARTFDKKHKPQFTKKIEVMQKIISIYKLYCLISMEMFLLAIPNSKEFY